VSAELREASSVILLRRTSEPTGFEVFLLRRQKKASFMASAFVFPGGAAEPGEDGRTTAARELFEEAGVLMARDAGDAETLEMFTLTTLRKKILEGASADKMLASAGLAWSTDSLVPWSHWITPSIEPKRFSARFFVCELVGGQEPTFDAIETVEQTWVRPAEALERSKELMLPPPQIRTFWELAQLATIEDVLAAARARADEPHPIMPRIKLLAAGEPPTLLLPWDPDYNENASGDATPLTYTPSWATGPSRFVLEDRAWKHVAAPGSTSAG
jgi:8-oxo-dGTP pyrophosphatase MutT (NUDIX family)